MLGECRSLVRVGYGERRSFSVRRRYGGPFSHHAHFEAALVGRPTALGAGSDGVWSFNSISQRECLPIKTLTKHRKPIGGLSLFLICILASRIGCLLVSLCGKLMSHWRW